VGLGINTISAWRRKKLSVPVFKKKAKDQQWKHSEPVKCGLIDFKCCSNLQNIKVVTHHQTPHDFPSILQAITKCSNYLPKLVFNVNETSHNWKRISSCPFTFHEQKHPQGFAASKYCFTLMLGSEALADLKLKLLIIYHPGIP
jgi:hypothetical protein